MIDTTRPLAIDASALAMMQVAQDWYASQPSETLAKAGYYAEMRDSRQYVTFVDGIAIVDVSGTLTKHEHWFFHSVASVQLASIVAYLTDDPMTTAILLHIESPGGELFGINELAKLIAIARKTKPTAAYISDLGASAAYWIASQCGWVSANATAVVGSIGTYCVMHDSSEAHQKAGVRVHVVRAGEHKGVGTPGTAITEEHLTHTQAIIDQTNQFFLKAVATGRSLSAERLKAVSDGRAHLAATAQSLGLIDHVETFEQCFERLKIAAKRHNSNPTL